MEAAVAAAVEEGLEEPHVGPPQAPPPFVTEWPEWPPWICTTGSQALALLGGEEGAGLAP